MKTIKEAKETPVVAEAEVLVIGGGPAGIAAATAAARGGARVILIERYGYLGGLATGGLVLLMDHLFDSSGRRCIDGITWELMCRLEKLGGLAGTGTPRQHADSEMLKIVADQICVESGVILRFHSWVVDAVMDGGRVTGVIAESKAGRHALLADICIDASGDGDLAAFAGASFETHTMRIGLNSKIGGVDRDEFAGWKEEHPDEAAKIRSEVLSRGGCPLGMGPTPYSDEGVFWVNNLGFAQREDETKPIPDGNDSFNGGLSAIDVETLTWVELESRKRILRGIEYYRKHVPGYQQVQLLAIASQLGVRDSRRIIGLRTVSHLRLTFCGGA